MEQETGRSMVDETVSYSFFGVPDGQRGGSLLSDGKSGIAAELSRECLP
jgi:hypothetical protein